jgi:hypothetical protein
MAYSSSWLFQTKHSWWVRLDTFFYWKQ